MLIFLAVVFGLLTMFAYALANVFSQPLARKLGTAQIIFLRGLIVAFILGLVALPTYHRLLYLQNVHYALYALALGVVGYLPLLAFVHGLKISKVGVIAPIAGTSPFIIVILSFAILHVAIKPIQWLAIALILIANVGASINPKSLRESNIVQLASGVPFALLAALGWGFFFYAFVYPTRELGPWLAAFLVESGVMIGAGLHVLISKEKPKLDQALSRGIVANGVCIAIGTVAYTVGVSRYNVGIVGALSTSGALASLLLAAYFFKERLNRTEKIAAVVMTLGVVLVTIS